MRRRSNLIVGATAVALLAPWAAWSADPSRSADISERGLKPSDFPRWHAVAPNVYAYEDTYTFRSQTLTTVSLIIVTTDGAVIVDGQDADRAKALVASIKKITPQPVKYLIIGNQYPDHTGGNATLKEAWPNLVFISAPGSKKAMEAAKLPVPSELVTQKRDLNLGGTKIQVLNLGRGDSDGDLAVYLPQSKVLFMSELYFRYWYPPILGGFPSEWVAAIHKAQAMDVTWYIPGHGSTDADAATLKADLNEFLKAIEYVISEGKRLHAAGLVCESAKNCPASQQANWGSYANWAVFTYPNLPEANIARVYMELDGKLPQ